MEPNQILDKFIDILEGTMFSKTFDLGSSRISFNQQEKAAFWNFAFTNQILKDNEIAEIEGKMKELDRKPVIYFLNDPSLNQLGDILSKKDYKKIGEDSWMFHNGENIDKSDFSKIKKVETESELKTWLDVLQKSYVADDPNGPYGALSPEYLELIEKAWRNYHEYKMEYFTAFEDEDPVAVGVLINQDGLGYICNIGSIKSVRGQKYGKLITLYCVNKSIENGNSDHCLATEFGTYPYDFYSRIGFEVRFTANYYEKNSSL